MLNSKDMLARLLANENLNVVRANANTASFDIVARTLVLPNWKDMSVTVEDMLISHEVGHALFTDQTYINTENYKVIHGYLNIIEDVRIEKKMKARYPGLRKIFTEAYKELNDKDFFEVASVNFSELLLIDRINLYYKCGMNCGVKFNKEEMDFVLRADRCDTIKDVQTLALEVYEYSYGKIKEKKEAENSDKKFSKEELEKIIKEELQQAKEEADTDVDDYDEDEDEDSDADYFDGAADDETGEKPEEPQLQATPNNKPTDEELSSKTERALKTRLQDMADVDTIIQKFTPEYRTGNTSEPLVEHKELIAAINEELSEWKQNGRHNEFISNFESSSRRKGLKFRTSANKVVNYLVKEFEMRKSADAYKRTTISKSGSLNPSKLAVYKLTEDLFKRISITKDSKNHGMVMLLDWSGSMSNVMADTLEQTITLALFCKRAQIPFQVYAFSDAFYRKSTEVKRNRNYDENYTGFDNINVHLLELFNHKMSASEMTKMIDYCIGGFYKLSSRLSFGGTPLNDSLLIMCSKIGEFKSKNNIEKVSFITLTDGDGGSLQGSYAKPLRESYVVYDPQYKNCKVVNILFDPMTKKEYRITTESSSQTKTLLQVIKDRWDATTVGFYIMPNRRRDYITFLRNNVATVDASIVKEHAMADDMQVKIRREGFMSLSNCGRDEMFVIAANKLSIDDADLDVSESMTTKQISKEFTKHLSGKKTNRVLLNRFVNLIA
jgi:hypothetical protein